MVSVWGGLAEFAGSVWFRGGSVERGWSEEWGEGEGDTGC